MKPFLGIDLTENKHNETVNGEEFAIAHTAPALAASLEQASATADNKIEESKLPLPLRVGQ